MSNKIKLVYIAGPYRANNCWNRQVNIFRAREAGAIVAENGHMPIVPHQNTANYDGIGSDQFWLDATLELCRRCDEIVMMEAWFTTQGTIAPHWKQSIGSRGEHDEMKKLGKPVYYNIHDWVRSNNDYKSNS